MHPPHKNPENAKPPKINHNHPQMTHQINPDIPIIHHSSSYPLGPDPFPGYFPHIHPHYHYDHDNKDNSHFLGIYAHNTPSLHDRYYPRPQLDSYGSGELYPAERYPDPESNMGQSGYSGNRKIGSNGYQVTDNTPDISMSKRE